MRRYIKFLVILVIGFVLGMYSGPSIYKLEEKKTQTKTLHNDTETKKSEVIDETILKRPDGTVETKRKITKGVIKVSKTKQESALTSVKKETKESLPNNQITLLYQPKSAPEYGVLYQRRIFSSLYVGGFVMNDKVAPKFGVSLTLGF